jgi:hypothetical protein
MLENLDPYRAWSIQWGELVNTCAELSWYGDPDSTLVVRVVDLGAILRYSGWLFRIRVL